MCVFVRERCLPLFVSYSHSYVHTAECVLFFCRYVNVLRSHSHVNDVIVSSLREFPRGSLAKTEQNDAHSDDRFRLSDCLPLPSCTIYCSLPFAVHAIFASVILLDAWLWFCSSVLAN